jgi:hypothetical protein
MSKITVVTLGAIVGKLVPGRLKAFLHNTGVQSSKQMRRMGFVSTPAK